MQMLLAIKSGIIYASIQVKACQSISIISPQSSAIKLFQTNAKHKRIQTQVQFKNVVFFKSEEEFVLFKF